MNNGEFPGPGKMDGQQSILAADMLYPDCPNSHTGLFVERDSVGEYMFVCLKCRRSFDPNITSKWYGVDKLNDAVARDYIAVEIRGYDKRRWARAVNVKYSTVKRNVSKAKRIIRSEKEKNGTAIITKNEGIVFED